MKKDQKSTVVNGTDSGLKKTVLNENELGNVSGGLELPTIIDLCPNKFDNKRCVNAPWGSCKHFSSVYIRQEQGIFQTCFYYTGSCAKGCFKDLPYQEFM